MTPELPPLQKAASQGDLKTLAALLANGRDVDAASDNGFTALAAAAAAAQTEAVHLLIERGANVNARGGIGRHVLLLAAWVEAERGDRGVVRALLDAGADVNLTSSWGETALQGAAAFPQGLGTVRRLLAMGPDVNIANRGGWTPLMQAALIGQTEIVHALLSCKPDLVVRNTDGLTACMIAAQYQHAELVRILTQAGVQE